MADGLWNRTVQLMGGPGAPYAGWRCAASPTRQGVERMDASMFWPWLKVYAVSSNGR
ncbi:hypothetical protein B0I35DRAFT_429148 [Stachybotrys elegans]|uniref:Uncharacterized protein n=1 Tax=Stachybotrys elegans TaxID=80388 RepID=A0A8K0WTN1_9HYPO|nr:hypothetical protein B0I35DRAFT_429148 [Stachybotrys elegans]